MGLKMQAIWYYKICIYYYSHVNCDLFQEFITHINYQSNSNVTELFDLRFDTLESNVSKMNHGAEEFSNIGFTVFLTRAPKTHLSNTYLPSGLLTFISFIGFLIPVDMVPGRMALLVTIFLMLVNISTMAFHRGPVVSVK